MKWEQVLDEKSIISEIETYLGNLFIQLTNISSKNIPLITFESEGSIKLAKWLKSNGFILESITGSDLGTKIELTYQFGYRYNRIEGTFLFRSLVLKKRVQESISEYFPSAHFWENLIKKRLGLKFYLIKNPLSKSIKTNSYYPITLNVPELKKYKSNRSIFHPVHSQGSYIHNKMKKGSQNNGFKLYPGWLYSNINHVIENISLETSYSNPIGHGYKDFLPELDLLYCLLLEQVFPVDINLKVRYIRMLLVEIARIISHLYWFSDLALLLHKFSISKSILKKIRLFKKLLKDRLEYDINSTRIEYGVAPDINSENAHNFLTILRKFKQEIVQQLRKFIKNRSVRANLLNLGVIPKHIAIEAGLTGPNLRASGVNVDLRENLEYLSYVTGPLSQNWSVVLSEDGDCFSRSSVRLYEIQESFNLCEEILSGLSQYQRKITPVTLSDEISIISNQIFTQGIESARGSLFMYLKTSEQDNSFIPHTVRTLTPDHRNYGALYHPDIFNGEKLRDLPIILHSLDIQYPLVDF